jgi:hypothetical protein
VRIFSAVRYYWVIAAGYRLRPWASPYVRWRLETFFGAAGGAPGPARFFGLLWKERRRLAEFLDWVEERRKAQRSAKF